MKKSQRLRLAALAAKVAQGLTAGESQELSRLAALAALHPNAAEDTDDTPEEKKKDAKKAEDDDEKKDDEKKEPTASDDEDEEKKKDAKKSEDADDEKKKDDEKKDTKAASRPGLTACLAGAFASLKGSGPATLAADLKTEREAHARTQRALDRSDADLATAHASLRSERAALGALCGWLGIKAEDVAGQTSAEIHAALATNFDKKINAAAIEQVAGLGFNAKGLPAPDATGTGEAKSKGELMREFNAITDPNARAAFYQRHKAAMGL